eukprot:TRINITY_DN50459_c0_g1_i1.p1 TRINITY_DN50459_c0_g1~~TRINITY_DN50459_c0_g1_i1.p1  ORF type:complete len:187 (-),score=10.08 TRINITY_DN50459_c0_g1_i1:219-779(-)
MHMRGILCIMLACTLSHATHAPQRCHFFDRRDPTPQPSLPNCTWYSQRACCTAAETKAVFETMPALPHDASPACLAKLEMLTCYMCSPDQHLWLRRSTGEVTVCFRLCDQVYEACKATLVDGRPFGRIWPSGTHFCEAHQFRVAGSEVHQSERRCFNSASRFSERLLPQGFVLPLLALHIFIFHQL